MITQYLNEVYELKTDSNKPEPYQPISQRQNFAKINPNVMTNPNFFANFGLTLFGFFQSSNSTDDQEKRREAEPSSLTNDGVS
jgi:hypothetical protein